jgi:hypothetical protein
MIIPIDEWWYDLLCALAKIWIVLGSTGLVLLLVLVFTGYLELQNAAFWLAGAALQCGTAFGLLKRHKQAL